MEEGSGTRSSMLWQVKRLLDEMPILPDVLLMENVDAIHNQDNLKHFQTWIGFLDSKGYSTFVHDLNARNYGTAQNRNRTFAVSILGDYAYHFPEPIELRKTMNDYLEDEVERYAMIEK